MDAAPTWANPGGNGIVTMLSMSVDNRRTARPAVDGDSAPRPIRRRPKNRRAQIAAASAAAFGALGYHGVSMEDIASGLGISSAALYRHFPSKYALFREELLRVGTAMTDSVRLQDEAHEWSPERRLRHVVRAVAKAVIDNRATVTLVRWEVRYLEEPDQRILAEQQSTVLDALGAELRSLRPELDLDDVRVLRGAMLSVLTSIADHHATLPAKALVQLLDSVCWTLAQAELPPAAPDPAPAAAADIPESFKHELLLRKAVELFHERGYPNVSVEEIATAAGLSAASAVYRFYRGKADLLAAAFRRAADRVSAAIGPAVASAPSPEAAMSVLIERYVAGSFAERALTFVYYTEFQHVPAEERAVLRNIQRLNVDEWAKLVRDVRGDLTAAETRFLVHAAFALVVDLGRSFGAEPIASQLRVRRLMEITLFGRPVSAH